jgi:polysaccharide biosynthesis/export protein
MNMKRLQDHGPLKKDHRPQTTDHGLRTTENGPQTTDHGPQTRLWTLGFGLWTFIFFFAASASGAGVVWTNFATVTPTLTNAAAMPATPPSSETAVAFAKLLVEAAATTNSTGVAPANMDTLDDKYRLAIGDRLSFRIQEDEEDPKALTVADAGDLEVPYIGRFPAENKTCKQLARELKSALEKEYYYQATVILAVDAMTKSRGKVYLVGPVRVPGAQDIPSDEVLTVSKAIMRAGGFNDFADRHNVKITRKAGLGETDTRTFVVDLVQILEKGKIDRDVTLEPGDLVLIPERLIRF